jgi:hypothetical protein
MQTEQSQAQPPSPPSSQPMTQAQAPTPPAGGSGIASRLLREPLLHFLVLGALVFGVDYSLNLNKEDPQTITISKSVKTEAHDIFAAGLKREPSDAEMKTLLDRWVDNEVLYREGIALGLDRGDSAIRDRIIFKALSVTQSGITLPKIDEAGVRKWFESKRERYDTPVRFDFLEAVVSSDRSAETLQGFVDALNGKGKSDAESSLRVFKDRPRPNLLQSYGADFTAAIEKSTPGTWQLINSNEGLRVVRLEEIKPGVPADFEQNKDAIYQDWRDDTMAQLTTNAVREMGKKYKVREEEVKP